MANHKGHFTYRGIGLKNVQKVYIAFLKYKYRFKTLCPCALVPILVYYKAFFEP
jgi:hypothetical protein